MSGVAGCMPSVAWRLARHHAASSLVSIAVAAPGARPEHSRSPRTAEQDLVPCRCSGRRFKCCDMVALELCHGRHHHAGKLRPFGEGQRSEEHTSELQSLMLISYAVFCLKKKTNK